MAKYITAKQLAEELLKHPNDIVCSVSDNFELNGAKIPQTSLHLNRYKGKIDKEYFSDAFDGGSYPKDVVSYNDNGTINFIQL